MLGFLRRMRRTLLDEGHLRKYLVYAFGEILLVVVGILLALQINTWNQGRLNSKEELRLLRDLSEELQFDRFLKEKGIEYMGEVLGAGERLLQAINHPTNVPAKEQLELDIHKLTWVWKSGRPTTAYDVLSGSGELALISSPELRKKLADLKYNQETLLLFEESQFNFVDQQLRPFLNRTVDRTTIRSAVRSAEQITTYQPSPFSTSYDDLLSNREFANMLMDLVFFTERLLQTYSRIERDIMQVDSLIASRDASIQAKPYVPY